ncbi:hypothetical protein Golax_017825 [Gossypium laxum]|uniref:GrpE protein homolog n=1 Tax=Gossypium laxum TaxID=34288 RepID=A0A7J8Z1I0_9ROSI|nr:hypothetical protein [Gossypium laxum]
MSRALSRVSKSVGARSLLLSAPQKLQTPSFPTQFHSLVCQSSNKLVTSDVFLLHHSSLNFSAFQQYGISSSASPPEPPKREHENSAQSNGEEPARRSGGTNPGGAEVTDQAKESDSSSDSDSESDGDLSMADMIKLVEEKDGLLEEKQKEIEQMKDKIVRTLAEMENVMARTRREADNSKKFAVQNFAKDLLDVADNLGRASAHVKGSFSKIDESNDTAGAVPLLKTLLEGVEMTEKQLGEVFFVTLNQNSVVCFTASYGVVSSRPSKLELLHPKVCYTQPFVKLILQQVVSFVTLDNVFRKYGVEKFDPTNEPFDPNMHNAVFQVPDNSKPPGTVAHVLKAGYMLYDRVIRPAEVSVTQAPDPDADKNNTSNKDSDA